MYIIIYVDVILWLFDRFSCVYATIRLVQQMKEIWWDARDNFT